jgi:ring-1,2-phenylacetyl-CoA epoxidase subunit PaaE
MTEPADAGETGARETGAGGAGTEPAGAEPAGAGGAGAARAAARRQFYPLEVTRVDQLCADAAAITFAVPPALAGEFRFRPGQSLTLRRQAGGREERRSYSICAPAGAAPRIGVREVPGGVMSGWLVREVRPGDIIEAQPPSGSFALPPETLPDLGDSRTQDASPALGTLPAPGTPRTSGTLSSPHTPRTPTGPAARSARHVLLAAGSGITPVLSIAASALARRGSQVTIIYGNRRADTVMFADDVADLKDTYPARLQLVHVLSREPQEVELFSGRLDAARLRRLLPATCDVDGTDHWWLCGPYGMVTDARAVLAGLGVPDDRIHRELFYVEDEPPPPVTRPEPAQPGPGETSAVTVILDGRATTTRIGRDEPVLDGAQRVRPDLPFACKGGVCGTCRALVRSGEVNMRRNFALEPAEVAGGYVLTCQSLPVSDELTMDYDA